MRYNFWIAWRYMLSRRFGVFGRLLMTVSIAGIAIAMLSLIVIMSVMRGFNEELTSKLQGFDPHITISKESLEAPGQSADEVSGWLATEGGVYVTPFVEGEVIVRSMSTGEPLAQGARLRGVSLEDDRLSERLSIRDLGDTSPYGTDDDKPKAALGNEVALNLAVHPAFDDTIGVIAPLADIGPTGDLVPNKGGFRVAGVFKSGIYAYDAKYILTELKFAKDLLGEQGREGFLLWFDDHGDLDAYDEILKENLPAGWKSTTWIEQNAKLFSALKLERAAMAAILIMALLISSFGIAVIVLLIVSSKRKDIAILKAIGMRGSDIRNIFLMNAALIGGIGSFIGLVLGTGVCLLLRIYPPMLPDSYYLDRLPVEIEPLVAVAFSLIGVIAAILAALYPVMRAVDTDVVEVLRYE